MNEILHRAATLTGVDAKLRLIDLIAVPYDEETDIMHHGEWWHEVFDPHAFDGLENHAGRVRVNREHIKGDTIGKVVSFDPAHPDGLMARVRVAQTPRGDDTLALAAEDMISASVGYFVKKPSDVQTNKRTKVRRVMRAFLDHLGMVESPAYEGAQVLSVREGQAGPTVVIDLPLTPSLDAVTADEMLAWAAQRLSRVGTNEPLLQTRDNHDAE